MSNLELETLWIASWFLLEDALFMVFCWCFLNALLVEVVLVILLSGHTNISTLVLVCIEDANRPSWFISVHSRCEFVNLPLHVLKSNGWSTLLLFHRVLFVYYRNICAFLQGGDGKFSIFVHCRPGFLLNKATTRSPYFLNRQVNNSVQVSLLFCFNRINFCL